MAKRMTLEQHDDAVWEAEAALEAAEGAVRAAWQIVGAAAERLGDALAPWLPDPDEARSRMDDLQAAQAALRRLQDERNAARRARDLTRQRRDRAVTRACRRYDAMQRRAAVAQADGATYA